MNKKAILIFLLGFIASGVLFGTLIFAQRTVSHGTEPSQSVLTPAIPKDIPAEPSLVNVPKSQVGVHEVSPSVETGTWKAFLSPEPDAHSSLHEVKAGDTLTSLSKKYHVTVDLVRRINQIHGDKLVLGAKLKIPTYKLSVVVDKSQNTLILKGDEEVLKTYTVATGVNNSTPVGVFKITDKLVHPTWYRPDGKVIPYGNPANFLGTRWMGLTKKGYGIHGTFEPEKLGQQITDGCVRMKNEEVEELYGFLTPGTEVTIVD